MRPVSIICDFEQAAIHAFQDAFPTVRIKGCFFHLAQNMHTHLVSLGLSNLYKTDSDFALWAKMIIALAFVPLEKMDEYMDTLAAGLPDELIPLFHWFEDTYIGRQNRLRNVRMNPMFAPEIWNLYERTVNDEDRTNNHAKAANRRLQYELGMHHPSIWKSIDALRKVQKGRDAFLEKLIAGYPPPKKLKKYRNADERIKKIVMEVESSEPIEFLKGIAHNYEMKK